MLDYSRINRTHLLAVITVLIMAVFVARLFYLQVIRHEYYAMQANAEQVRQWDLPAERGEIYALNHNEPIKLALNETVYTVWADPKVLEEPGKVITTLKAVVPGKVQPNFESLLDKKDSRYQILAKRVSYKEAQTIKKEKLYGIGFERGVQRVYPEGQLASQVLGFVNTENKGQYGIEGYFDTQLKGTPGVLKTVKDVRDVPLSIGNNNINRPAINGDNIVLTIDRNVQMKAEQVLAKGMQDVGAKYGSMIVMDPASGKVMAMANMPTYDPSNYSKIDDIAVLNNRIISRPYEPASVMKTFTMSTGVDKGVMNPDSTYNNTDSIRIADITIGNASKGQTGSITMQHALNWSLNTGTVTMAQWLGGGSINYQARSTMYDYFHNRFRLGQLSGIELSGEAPGIVISPDDVQGNAPRYANMTFGQGLDVTPLQVATGFSAIVNGGVYHDPTVIEGKLRSDGTLEPARQKAQHAAITPETSATMKQMIIGARQAFYASGDRAGYEIGGKTGTAQTIENGKYVFETTEGTYLGFGGEKGKTPSYVILLTFAAPGVQIGGQQANPAFTDMSNWMIDYLKLQPKG